MLTEQPNLISSVLAAVALSKNLCVSFEGDIPSAGDPILGICNADTDALEYAPLVVEGIALVKSGAAVSVGAGLEVNGTGKVITKASGTLIGYALDPASGADQLIRVLLK